MVCSGFYGFGGRGYSASGFGLGCLLVRIPGILVERLRVLALCVLDFCGGGVGFEIWIWIFLLGWVDFVRGSGPSFATFSNHVYCCFLVL